MIEADSSAPLTGNATGAASGIRLPGWLAVLLTQVLIALAFFGAAGIGAEMALLNGYAPLIWPALGFAIAIIYLQGHIAFVGVFAGACIMQYTQPENSAVAIVLMGLAQALPAWLAAVVLKSWVGFRPSMERIVDVGLFSSIALLAASFAFAFLSTGVLCMESRVVPWSEFGRLTQSRFWAGFFGSIMIAPLLLVWRSETRINWDNRQVVEVCLWMATLIFFGVVIYQNWAPTDTLQYPLELTFFPLLAWGAIRFGQRGATTGILLLAIMAVFELRNVIGPDATKFHTQSPATLWAFWGIVSLTSLFLAAVLTEHRNREDHFRHNEERLRAFLSAMPDTAYMIERSGLIREIFTAPGSALEGQEDAFAGKPLEALFGDNNTKQFKELIEESILSGRVEVIDYQVVYNGRKYWYEGRVSAVPALREGGEPLVVWVAYDISDRKHYEESLKQARISADAANQAKGEFLAMMSHEIRTPMNAIIGFADILSRTEMDASQAEYLRIIRSSGNGLLELINNILDYSKIESKHIELEAAPFNFENTMVEVLEMVLIKARDKGIVLDYKYEDKSGGNFVGDPFRLRQIILNLVNNAVKFTSEGSVVVAVKTEQLDASRWRVQVDVKDTGIGIPPEKLDRLFKAFSQVDSSTTRRFGGTGLGLVISKRLIESMGGKIWVDSKEGEGSTFSFCVDLLSSEAIYANEEHLKAALEPAGVEFAEKQPLRVLIVEDDQVNRQMVTDMVLRLGYEPAVAVDGKEAMEIMQRRTLDVALVDIEMPEVDGFELLYRVREGEVSPDIKDIYMIAHTAYAMEEDRRRCLTAGFNAYLPKPVLMTDIQLVLAEAHHTLHASKA